MSAMESYFDKLGKIVVAIAFIWLGGVGLLNEGFTTISTLPLIEVASVVKLVFVMQVVIGIGIFSDSIKNLALPIIYFYFGILIYNSYVIYDSLFVPALPYLSDIGTAAFMEVLAIYAAFNYLKKPKYKYGKKK